LRVKSAPLFPDTRVSYRRANSLQLQFEVSMICARPYPKVCGLYNECLRAHDHRVPISHDSVPCWFLNGNICFPAFFTSEHMGPVDKKPPRRRRGATAEAITVRASLSRCLRGCVTYLSSALFIASLQNRSRTPLQIVALCPSHPPLSHEHSPSLLPQDACPHSAP
jgi:hypothetical protein